jgi:ferric-dicitrate binding protein FerR (iron transport regulator)
MIIFAGGLSAALYKTITFLNREQGDGYINILANNKPKEFALPDGSSVTLNAGSRLTFNSGYNELSREVILEGEALFEVLPDKNHPFKVFTGESVIEVTGTRFNVRQEDGSVKVAVITGTVLLSNTSSQPDKISISANQSGYLLPGNELKLEDGIEINGLSWKTGHLIFDETPIDSALIDIARHFRKELLIETAISEEITAEFQDQALGEILDEINLVAGLKFDTSGTALIVRK